MSDEKPQHPNEQEETAQGNTLPVLVPHSEFTIPANRLAGSVECLNCGTILQGPFCHYCGQPDKNLVRFFRGAEPLSVVNSATYERTVRDGGSH